jgi:hypothetical protein
MSRKHKEKAYRQRVGAPGLTLGSTKLVRFLRRSGDWILAEDSFGFGDEGHESRDMPNNEGHRGTHDIPTSDAKFRGPVKYGQPEKTIQHDENEGNQIYDIDDFEEAHKLREERV